MPAWLRNEEERRQLFAALRSVPQEPVRGAWFVFICVASPGLSVNGGYMRGIFLKLFDI